MIWKERKNERERETKSAHNVAGAFKQIGEAKSASDVIQPININITIRNRQIKRIVVESKIISLLTRQIENGPSLPLHARMLHHWHSYFQTISMNSPQIFSSTQLYCKHCIATICSTSNAAWWIKRKKYTDVMRNVNKQTNKKCPRKTINGRNDGSKRGHKACWLN